MVALLDPHYDEMWVGGKASYKLGAIIEDGGELIIYAPHLTKISETHGALIEKYGYAPLEVVRDLLGASAELRENLCIAAHLVHVAYAGAPTTTDVSFLVTESRWLPVLMKRLAGGSTSVILITAHSISQRCVHSAIH